MADSNNKRKTSSPTGKDLIAKVNLLANARSAKPAGSLFTNPIGKQAVQFDYARFVTSFFSLSKINSPNELIHSLYKIICSQVDCDFIATGIFNEKSKCLNIKLLDKLGNIYSSKVFTKDSENPIAQCFLSGEPIYTEDADYLKFAYFHTSSVLLIPMMSLNKPIGVMILSGKQITQSLPLYHFVADYAGLIIHNGQLLEKSGEIEKTDTLTQLLNHRGFHERLTKEFNTAETSEKPFSVIMMDINNISKINRELSHAKGDEVIKLVAEKVKQNIRERDIAGRYGGDEIAIILPDTDVSEAKYLAEYITYSLSCCFIDDVGPVKVSVGIATFPTCSRDKEKLLILAEQAMYISQAKGYKDGMSAIISSSDYNFWDDVALKSYAEVITKRHTQLGVNFEEEIINKFNAEQIKSSNHLEEIATSLAGAIDAKDPYTKGHSTSVSRYSEALARSINLSEAEIEQISLGALLHDVGKIGIPENVLRKTSNLSDDEWNIMKQHPVIGAEKVLKPNPILRELIPIVKYHHERIDGKGYPEGLKGPEIPLAAKIVAIADTFHALVSDRPYRKGMSLDKACEILICGAGTQWDEDLVRKFIQIAPSLSSMI